MKKVFSIWYLVSGIRKNTGYIILNTKYRKPKGFTLIELLIVITILGILAGLTLVSYSGTQERARDSKRKQELDAIKKALELAKQDSTGQYYYPACTSYTAGACNLTTGTATIPDLTAGTSPYIKTLPTDPKTTVGYKYIPTPANCASNLCTDYTLAACLENGNDLQGVTDATNCPTAPQKAYKVTPN
ncbi:prepilin-type N-terminal cleavage/methylation domain-containing protein [Candidatus Curtissbacteria bacterium]|nr:prepilin-type N-terminal cleavage/methylation domain-containing protein [Candidatus Curtissbacteria bacterium]